MLKILLLSFCGAFVCTLIAVVLPGVGVRNRKDWKLRIMYASFTFLLEFVWMILVLYTRCYPQTAWSVIMWMFIPLIISALVGWYFNARMEMNLNMTLATISILFCLSKLVAPVQEIIYVHDMENVTIPYTISSEELLAKTELKMANNDKEPSYYFSDPTMRKVDGKEIGVYKINARAMATEYIPGYVIQEDITDNKFNHINKRIYFDRTYFGKKDALRTIRRAYPTIILGEHQFDVDDDWNPYEVYVYRESFYTSNGKDYGVVVLNLKDGSVEKYPAVDKKTPKWLDFESTEPR